MGRKSIIPYGLYRAEGYISAALANKVTGLDEEDVELLWMSIINMFEHDHSAARGKMCMRKLYIFKHESVLGNYPSHLLFEKIVVKQKDMDKPPREFSDYEITVDDIMPQGVELIKKLWINTEITIRSIQHYLYCPHRWGLIEINDCWAENIFVTKANFLHERVHDPDKKYSLRW